MVIVEIVEHTHFFKVEDHKGLESEQNSTNRNP